MGTLLDSDFIWFSPVFPLMSFLSVPGSNPIYYIAFRVVFLFCFVFKFIHTEKAWEVTDESILTVIIAEC